MARSPKEASRVASRPPADTPRSLPFPIVGIGASAGGLEAVSGLLRAVPADLGMSFVVVQHLDPTHASSLAELLGRVCRMPVCQAEDAIELRRDHVYVIPPDRGMVQSQGRLRLSPRAESSDPQRPIDLFLASLAVEARDWSIGVILSGTGTDGTAGLEAIKAEGGITFAQDASATYDSMPASATNSGCVDHVMSPEGIASELTHISRHPIMAHDARQELEPAPDMDGEQHAYEQVLRALSDASGVDFFNYKQATLQRRIRRRMVVRRIARMQEYRDFLDENPEELDALGQDILINVTSFFRDSQVFEALKDVVLPSLIRDRPPGTPKRIWVPGCATGEEVYSVAICLLEALGPLATKTPIKVFGTDVSDSAIVRARTGWYPARIADDIDPERLQRFFVKNEGGYRVVQELRDLCVFARQDATRDPPFSNLDLITCRNVLIYLGPVLQQRVLPIFHYALRDGGFLVLGSSETVGMSPDLFNVVDPRRRIYTRRPVPSRLFFNPVGADPSARHRMAAPEALPHPRGAELHREADRILLSRYAPPGVLIDAELEILQFRGNTGACLAPAPGTPDPNLRRMAREGLFPALGEAIKESVERKVTVAKQGLRVRSDDGGTIEVDVEVIPVRSLLSPQRCFLILFHVAPPAERPARSSRSEATGDPATERSRIDQLEAELASASEYIRMALEEREVAIEELRASNEEMLSGNEELQSTNEELQTAHEELQATNEELLTVNEELERRIEEAKVLGSDLTCLLSSVEIPIVMLSSDLRIRRYTPSAGKLLNVIPSDVDRSILDLKPKIDIPDLPELLIEVLDTLAVKQREVQDQDGRWYSLHIRPYRGHDERIDGVVITLGDIDAIKRNSELLQIARDYAENVLMTVREPLLVLDHDLNVQKANSAFVEAFGAAPAQLVTPGPGEAPGGAWQVPALIDELEDVKLGSRELASFELEIALPGRGHRVLLMDARRVQGGDMQPSILLGIVDMTDRRREEAEAGVLARRLQETQRLRSLGVLAGGIAHDFNNILTVILGCAGAAKLEVPPESGSVALLENIEQSALRAADLCGQMLAYAGKGRFVVKRLDLSALIEGMQPLLRASVSKKADLHFDLDPDLPVVVGDAAQLRQVAMNLIINASEALGENGGTITVRTSLERPDRGALMRARVVPENFEERYVCLRVEDDGCGMDAETQGLLFDPFFSRKFTGRGLGLAAVVGIVRSHSGALELVSEPGAGSAFSILLPAVAGSAEPEQPAVAGDLTWRGEGRVLVVDDEERVRALLVSMLGQLGFETFTAEDGRAGLERFRAAPEEVDVILLDLTMPRMDGIEAFRELRKIRPDARIVLMSGYDDLESRDMLERQGLAGFLSKPFQLGDLVATLRPLFERE